MTLRAADGTRLAGWSVPSRNGAAVVLVHGGGGDRNGVRRQALRLAQHGYGVLLYDERGRGESGGTTQSMGWNWVQDVRAAVDYASEQHRVRAVGALGLSTGAEVVVTAAAHDSRIRAVVAEGLINRDLADSEHQKTSDNITGIPYWWVTFQALRVETGAHPPEPLTEDLRRIAPRPVLIIAAAKTRPSEPRRPRTHAQPGRPRRIRLAQADRSRRARDDAPPLRATRRRALRPRAPARPGGGLRRVFERGVVLTGIVENLLDLGLRAAGPLSGLHHQQQVLGLCFVLMHKHGHSSSLRSLPTLRPQPGAVQ